MSASTLPPQQEGCRCVHVCVVGGGRSQGCCFCWEHGLGTKLVCSGLQTHIRHHNVGGLQRCYFLLLMMISLVWAPLASAMFAGCIWCHGNACLSSLLLCSHFAGCLCSTGQIASRLLAAQEGHCRAVGAQSKEGGGVRTWQNAQNEQGNVRLHCSSRENLYLATVRHLCFCRFPLQASHG